MISLSEAYILSSDERSILSRKPSWTSVWNNTNFQQWKKSSGRNQRRSQHLYSGVEASHNHRGRREEATNTVEVGRVNTNRMVEGLLVLLQPTSTRCCQSNLYLQSRKPFVDGTISLAIKSSTRLSSRLTRLLPFTNISCSRCKPCMSKSRSCGAYRGRMWRLRNCTGNLWRGEDHSNILAGTPSREPLYGKCLCRFLCEVDNFTNPGPIHRCRVHRSSKVFIPSPRPLP